MTDSGRRPSEALDARYGRSPARRRRNRLLAIGTAAAFVVVFACWVIWVGLGSGSAFDGKTTGYLFVDDSTIQVSFAVTMPPGSAARCAIEAQSDSHAVVGWKVVDIPAADAWTQTFRQTLRTSERAVTGLIYQCWVA